MEYSIRGEYNEKKKSKAKYFLIICIIIMLFVKAFDSRLKVINYSLESEKVSGDITLVLISDLHGCEYGDRQLGISREMKTIPLKNKCT